MNGGGRGRGEGVKEKEVVGLHQLSGNISPHCQSCFFKRTWSSELEGLASPWMGSQVAGLRPGGLGPSASDGLGARWVDLSQDTSWVAQVWRGTWAHQSTMCLEFSGSVCPRVRAWI